MQCLEAINFSANYAGVYCVTVIAHVDAPTAQLFVADFTSLLYSVPFHLYTTFLLSRTFQQSYTAYCRSMGYLPLTARGPESVLQA